ncbi:MAG: copper amine oxidase N-terminal domain-containing protein, partial [Acetomicrobium flavidum]|uniref:copper amine oxidase N-terminal domain-containing protein n=1 Tax=Acetomicrobium flavidum TaxID=49896 RepID=UPI0016948E15|nr:copper amine oxidase N-terminal domain-containing protein [Acetomicrobium flavidum]
MKGMKKLFALVAVLALALTLTPVLTANAATPIFTMTVKDPVWTTEKALGLDLNGGGLSEDLVLMIQGSIGGVDTLTATSFDFDAAFGLYVAVSNNNFTVYVFYNEISAVEDGVYTLTYEIAPGNVLSAEIPLQLFKVEPKDAVPAEVTSGEKVTITGTVAPLEDTLGLNVADYKVFVWAGTTSVASATISTTGTFSLTFNAYGNVGTKYNITVQELADTVYNGVPYYTIEVKNLADVTVNLNPETIVAGVENDVTLQLLVGDVKLDNHIVTGTITLGSETATFAGTTDEGSVTATGVKFNSVGVADVTVKVSGPDYFGTGAAKLNVSTSEEYGLAVKWPTWSIGVPNTVEFSTPYAGYTVSSVKVKVSGPVKQDGETLTGVNSIQVTPLGYGELTLQVEAVLAGTPTQTISKTFSTKIPGYVATVDPEELVRGATQTLTVVVKDAYGNPVNNALVQFFSAVNSADPIAKLDGKVTTSVNNGTYKLSIPGHKITKADANSYVEVKSNDVLRAKVFVEIARSPGINITLDKNEIVLGPKTTLTVTVASPEALGGASLKLVDADGENTGVLAYTFTGAATVQKVTLPVNTMPEEAGAYQVVVESANYMGSATLTFVEPVITATPAELLANSSNVVTFTSANVEDLRAVTSVTATGAVKSITAEIAEEAITATIVTTAEKGSVKVIFKFNSGYEHEVELSSVYGKLTVENATIAFGTKVLAFTPVNAAGATLAAGTEVRINLLGNEYSGYVAADGSVSILIPELPMGTYSVLVKTAGYQDATFSLVVVEAEVKPEYETIIELAPGMDVYSVNGETKFWDATPYIKEGRTLVPIRHLAEAVGFKASWDFSDPANKMVFIF